MSKLNKIFKKVGIFLNKIITENDTQNKLSNYKIHKKFKLLENFFNHDFIKETFLYERYYNEFKNIEDDFRELFKTEEAAIIKIAVVGAFSCGKSSFINSIVGEDITPVAINPTTCFITTFAYGNKIVIKNAKGETITKEQYKNMVKDDKLEGNEFYIYYPCEKLKSIEILDTPGTNSVRQDNKISKSDTDLSKLASERADIIFYLPNIADGTLDASSLENIKKIKQNGKNKELYIIFNQSDKKSPNERRHVYESVKKLLEGEKIEVSNYLIYSSLPVEKQKQQINKKFFAEKKQELFTMLDEIVNNKSKILSYKNNLKMINIEHIFEDLISKIKKDFLDIVNDDFEENFINLELYNEKKEKKNKITQHIAYVISFYEEILSTHKKDLLRIYDPGFMCNYRIVPNKRKISKFKYFDKDKDIFLSWYDKTVKDFFDSSLEINTETWFENIANEYLIDENNRFYKMFKSKIKNTFEDIENKLIKDLDETIVKHKDVNVAKYKKYIKELKNILNKI